MKYRQLGRTDARVSVLCALTFEADEGTFFAAGIHFVDR